MSFIQIILIAGFFLLSLVYLFKFRSSSFDKLIFFLFLITGVILVVFPDLTTKVAGLVGVGRGTDLILYLSIVAFLFVLLLYYSKIKKMERNITEIVRKMAIEEEEKGEKKL